LLVVITTKLKEVSAKGFGRKGFGRKLRRMNVGGSRPPGNLPMPLKF
jgi:hypothetical protein